MADEPWGSDDSIGIFGIDLGTTYSAISRIDEWGKAVVIKDEISGLDTTPSVVFFENDTSIVVGQAAKEAAVTHPDQVVSLIKREMGTKGWESDFFGSVYTPPAISALILGKLKQDAELATGQRVEQVVITVPAYFGLLEREATRQAGAIAGLDVIGIIPEPVAAALQYEVAGGAEATTVLVYDLGGGTFDVSVMSISAGRIEVLVTDGDHLLGGADWDKRLLDHVKSAAIDALGTDEMLDDDGFMQELLRKVEDTKRRLSVKESETIKLRFGGASADVPISRDVFEDLTRDLLEQTLTITQRALDSLKSLHGATKIDEVLLVGGSSLMPAVSRSLRERFGWDPKLSDPHLTVAKGAAIYAAARSVWKLIEPDPPTGSPDAPRLEPIEPDKEVVEQAVEEVASKTGINAEKLGAVATTSIVNVLPKAIGVELVDTTKTGWESDPGSHLYVEHLIPANTQLAFKADTFVAATLFANQSAVEIKLYEQAGPVADPDLRSNIPIQEGVGAVDLAGTNLPAGSPIHIDVHADNEGQIRLVATEPKSGNNLKIEVQMSLLSPDEVAAAKSNHLTRVISS